MPLALKYLCPRAVAYIGLGAVAAAVMSSADSSMLSAASLLTANVIQEFYTAFTGDKLSNEVGAWVLRVNILILGTIATVIAITYTSVYKLFYFCSDLVFVLVFPHLTTALFMPDYVNPLGSLVAFVFGALLRYAK